jgi:CDP-diglyceride synthetase
VQDYCDLSHNARCCATTQIQLFLVGMSSFWIKTVEEYGLVWVLFPAFLVVVNDTMAYVFGVLLGKHKLLPRLSPKKTVEGFVGAGLSTLAVAAPLLRRMLMGSIATTTSVQSNATLRRQHALIMALYVSLISPFGGFLASAVKRAHDAKDFGSLIPGHGGVVDRFDCQVVTAPFVYLYLTLCST